MAEEQTKMRKKRQEMVSMASGVNWTRMMMRTCWVMYDTATPTGRTDVGMISAGYCQQF